jgi:hypothetical protein
MSCTLYDRALSEPEIRGLYLAGELGKCSQPAAPTSVNQHKDQQAFEGDECFVQVDAIGTLPLTIRFHE